MAGDDPTPSDRSFSPSPIPTAKPKPPLPNWPTPANSQPDLEETQPDIGAKPDIKEETKSASDEHIKTEKIIEDNAIVDPAAHDTTLIHADTPEELTEVDGAVSEEQSDLDSISDDYLHDSSSDLSDVDEEMLEDGSYSDTLKRGRDSDSDSDEADSDTDDSEGDIIRCKKQKKCNVITDETANDHAKRAQNGKKTSTRKTKVAAKKKKKNQKKSKSTAQLPERFDLDRLETGNIIDNAHQVADLDGQQYAEEDTTRLKTVLLKQIMKGVPEEYKESAEADKERLSVAINIWGSNRIKATASGIVVPGVKTPLKIHQFLTAAFMIQRERSSTGPQSGIVADQMGLGKTLAVLAVHAYLPIRQINETSNQKLKLGAMLVIASPALLKQWHDQTRLHTEHRKGKNQINRGIGSVILYKKAVMLHDQKTSEGRRKLDAILKKADIVLATYHDVVSSSRKVSLKRAKGSTSGGELIGGLHRFTWGRIVVDEAQNIKDPKSQIAGACFKLNAKHYWLVTGTPVMNAARELFSYFKFMRYPELKTIGRFEKKYCSQGDEESEKLLKELLGRFMTRHKAADILFGRKLLDLPPPDKTVTMELDFSSMERLIYDRVKSSFEDLASEKDGFAQVQIFRVMLLRLRQLTDHSYFLRDAADRMDIADYNALMDAKNSMSEEDDASQSIESLQKLFSMAKREGVMKRTGSTITGDAFSQRETSAMDRDDMTEDHWNELGQMHGLGGFGTQKSIDAIASEKVLNQIMKNTTCVACHGMPSEPQITACEHIICHGCIKTLQRIASHRKIPHASCPKCSQPITEYKKLENFVEPKAGLLNIPKPSASNRRRLRDEEFKLGMSTHPSIKTLAMKSVVTQWLKQDPEAKIIIFSQFTDMLRQLQLVCKAENWECRTYIGSDNLEERTANLEDFKDKALGVQILLAGLKCGSEGLNLTAASRVLIIEPWWNQAAENQAFCRVYRLGQTKVCKLVRLIVKDSIDEDLVNLKEAKEKNIGAVMEAKSEFEKYLLDVMDDVENVALDDLQDDIDAAELVEQRPKHKLKAKA